MTETPAAPPEAPAQPAPTTPETPETPPETPSEPKPAKTVEDLEAELAKTRREAANYRTKLREAEPLVKKAQEAEDANKTETQKALDRAQAAEQALQEREVGFTRLELAVQHNIPPEDIDLIGSGTREQMEANAKRVAALNAAASKATPPPTDRPVEGLRPGATPEPPKPADDSYPSAWKPAYLREREERSFSGQ